MKATRQTWVDTLLKTANPVFEALAANELRARMPLEHHPDSHDRDVYTHLEALGRSLAGIGPWLELDNGVLSGEEKERQRMLQLVRESLKNATDPNSPDFLNFSNGQQPVVDAAFLAQGLLRSWSSVWMTLSPAVQEAIIVCMKSTRAMKPYFNNWLLFSAMVEAFLCKAGQEWDRMRVDYAIRQHEQWYVGDGTYGDGPNFHWDYYNSFVIQPMLFDLTHIAEEIGEIWSDFGQKIATRARRYAVIQERMISPEGTFPIVGRSMTYRFGVFHHLAAMVLHHQIPPSVSLPGIRCAMTKVMKNLLETEGTFDQNGWLQIGCCGHQPSLGERYISTGSLYLTLCGFLPLGLPESDSFWSEPDADWTSKRVWNGENSECDHAL